MSRHRTLDEQEAQQDAPWLRPTVPKRPWRASEIPMAAGGGGCWRGEGPAYHDWPGKADGAPHPRPEGPAA